ncbi:HIT domain-containing protein [Nocardia beijingensis]|uniref:HIT family protein n=1 Tax=Nocardia beijingensis TaxID=95162 RepID=UPI003450300C
MSTQDGPGYDVHCTFCSEIQFGPEHPQSAYGGFANEAHASRIIWEDDDLLVLPTIGPIAAGHTMILTREHYLSFAHVPEELAHRVEKVTADLSERIGRFGSVILFEHGPMSEGALGGACTDHAHLHCLPIGDADIKARIDERLTGRRITSLADLSEQLQRNQAYVFYRSQRGESWVYDVTVDLPCQFLRRITAEAVGNAEQWDWMVCPRPEVVHQTLSEVSW